MRRDFDFQIWACPDCADWQFFLRALRLRFRLMPSVYIKTYGCQMNERDSEQVARMLVDARLSPSCRDETEADVILLNTCSVRDMAEQKAIGKMGMLQRLRAKRPHLVLRLPGLHGAEPRRGTSRHPPRASIWSPARRNFIGWRTMWMSFCAADSDSRMDDERLPHRGCRRGGSRFAVDHSRPHPRRTAQATAFVSIMQGCNMHCAFCIVPQTRGAERSRSRRRYRRGGPRACRERREGSHAARPNRQPLRAPRV